MVAGSACGGAALVVASDAGIKENGDFHHKTVATPQLGNTQDVAARVWFSKQGYHTREKGGDLELLPIANPDQVLLFKRKKIHAAWTVEPWVTRLETEAGGTVFLDEKELWPGGVYATTILVARRGFVEKHPDLLKRVLLVHVQATEALRQYSANMLKDIAAELERETSKPWELPILEHSFKRVQFSYELNRTALGRAADDAYATGFLRERPDLSHLFAEEHLRSLLNDPSTRGSDSTERLKE
jgi:NitT/TauT family transport system substrate-binding protein